jgi:hypothetical protein
MARSRGQSAPLIPHLGGLKPSPEVEATRVLYDRLNDLDGRMRTTLAAQQTIIDQQAATITGMQQQVTDNMVAMEIFLSSQAFATQVGAEAGVPVPPPGEPGPGEGGGTPPPPPGAVPIPNHRVYVEEMAAQYPADLAAAEGNPTPNRVWLTRVCLRLRAIDTRWGYNINPSSALSHDKLAYYYGADGVSREGSIDVYTFDIIGDLGGANTPQYTLVATGQGARWTGNGEF